MNQHNSVDNFEIGEEDEDILLIADGIASGLNSSLALDQSNSPRKEIRLSIGSQDEDVISVNKLPWHWLRKLRIENILYIHDVYMLLEFVELSFGLVCDADRESLDIFECRAILESVLRSNFSPLFSGAKSINFIKFFHFLPASFCLPNININKASTKPALIIFTCYAALDKFQMIFPDPLSKRAESILSIEQIQHFIRPSEFPDTPTLSMSLDSVHEPAQAVLLLNQFEEKKEQYLEVSIQEPSSKRSKIANSCRNLLALVFYNQTFVGIGKICFLNKDENKRYYGIRLELLKRQNITIFEFYGMFSDLKDPFVTVDIRQFLERNSKIISRKQNPNTNNFLQGTLRLLKKNEIKAELIQSILDGCKELKNLRVSDSFERVPSTPCSIRSSRNSCSQSPAPDINESSTESYESFSSKSENAISDDRSCLSSTSELSETVTSRNFKNSVTSDNKVTDVLSSEEWPALGSK